VPPLGVGEASPVKVLPVAIWASERVVICRFANGRRGSVAVFQL
jgi:hypothetical protein